MTTIIQESVNPGEIIRQSLPKNKGFKTITDKELIHTMKRLGFKTLNQVLLVCNLLLYLLLGSTVLKLINLFFIILRQISISYSSL